MAKSECKKCHKPLESGKKCDACKQKGMDDLKAIGKGALTLGVLVLSTLPVIKHFKK